MAGGSRPKGHEATAGALKYVYDAEGNLQEARTNDSNNYLQVAYEWDYRQRLTKVTFKNATGSATTRTVQYTYDGFDRRVSSTVTDYVSGVAQTPTTQTYVFDEGTSTPLAPGGRGAGGEGGRGDVILDFVDSDGAGGNASAVAKRYLWGQAVDQLFAQEDVAGKALADSARYAWLVQDKLATVRDVFGRSGALIARVEYNAFGVITSVTNASGTPVDLPTRFTFTAQEYDPVTGNIWFSNGAGRGRWYSPTLNRFLQPDELGFAAGDMNLYRYVGNGPTNASDPSGQDWLDDYSRNFRNFFSPVIRLFGTDDKGAAAGHYVAGGDQANGDQNRRMSGDAADMASDGRFMDPRYDPLASSRPRVEPEDVNCIQQGASIPIDQYSGAFGRVTPRPGVSAMGRAAGEAADTAASRADNAASGISKHADSACPPPAPKGKFRGGKHGDTKLPAGDGLDSHHSPADAISPFLRDDGPAFQMEPRDHRRMTSTGSSQEAKAWRQKQKDLIAQGKVREAVQMDIDQARRLFGNKYDEAIKEMLDYITSIGY